MTDVFKISLYKKSSMYFLCLCMILLSGITTSKAQTGNDTLYYRTYPKSIAARFYFSQKYTAFALRSNQKKIIDYRPNTTFNMGVGATYKDATLNLAYGFPFLNPDEGKGKTKYLDLQFHNYPGKWALDAFGEFYNGYYLVPEHKAAAPGNDYYVRPDLKVRFFGASLLRVLNHRRFSYRASFIQSEWQKRSAGSWLLGSEFYFGRVRADSAFVPSALSDNSIQSRMHEMRFLQLGPSAGYAYTQVLPYHFFITASATLNAGINFLTQESDSVKSNRLSISPNMMYRLAAGYHDGLWNVSVTWVNDRVVGHAIPGNYYAFNIGNYRLHIARRLDL